MLAFTNLLNQIGLTVLFILVVKILSWHWKNRKVLAFAHTLNKFYFPLPLIGHAYLFFKASSNVAMTSLVLRDMRKAVTDHIYTTVMWLGPVPLVTISDPRDVQILLNSSKAINEAEEHKLLNLCLGNGLLSAPGHVWKVTRRHLSPLFHPVNLAQLMPMANECGRDLTSHLGGHEGPVDVSNPVFAVALKSAYSLIFGVEDKINIQSNEFQGLMKFIDTTSDILGNRLYKYWAFNDFFFKIIFRRELNALVDGWDQYLKEPAKRIMYEIKKKTNEYKENSKTTNEGNDNHIEEALLADKKGHLTLVEAYEKLNTAIPSFTEKDLQNEIMTFMVAGSDTTRGSLALCFLAIAAYPEVQEKLYAEVVSVVGTGEDDVTTEDLRALTYVEQVIKETLRKYVTVPTITRKITEDLKLSEYTLPAGTTVCLILSAVHHNVKSFPDPDKFDPDRFAPESVAQREKYSFVAFSGGPRNCIGKNYAMNVMKTWIVHVVRRYKLTTKVDMENIKYRLGFVVSCVQGYDITFERR